MIPAPFWTLEALVLRWHEPLDVVKARAEAGQFALSTMDIDGEPRAGISGDELRRIESEPANDAAMRTDAKRSHLEAVAVLMAYAFGSDPATLHSRTTEGELSKFAAASGIPLSRCARTYADILKGGAAILLRCGYLKPEDAQPQTQADNAKPRTKAAA